MNMATPKKKKAYHQKLEIIGVRRERKRGGGRKFVGGFLVVEICKVDGCPSIRLRLEMIHLRYGILGLRLMRSNHAAREFFPSDTGGGGG